MKKICNFSLLISILTTCIAFSQVSVSEPYRIFDTKQHYYFAKGDQTMAVKVIGSDVMIQKFDNYKPALVKQTQVDDALLRNAELEDVIEVNQKYYIFFSVWDSNESQEKLLARQIDFESGQLIGASKLLLHTDGKAVKREIDDFRGNYYWTFMKRNIGKFDIFCSYDKKQILVQYQKKSKLKSNKKDYDIIGLGAFDEQLNTVSIREITMPYTESRMNNLDYKLDNKGNLYLLAKVFHDDSNEERKNNEELPNYHIELLTIKAGIEQIQTTTLGANQFINSLWLFDTPNDYLLCVGFYSNGQGRIKGGKGRDFSPDASKFSMTGESDGVVCFKIDSNGNSFDAKYNEIPLSLMDSYESMQAIKKNAQMEKEGKGAKIANLVMREANVNSDGSIVLFGEQYYVQNMQTPYNTGKQFHFDDILAVKLNPSGVVDFIKRIPKKQTANHGKTSLSFKYFFANNKHYFVFMDNIKNIGLIDSGIAAEYFDANAGHVTAVSIDDTTKQVEKKSLFDAKDINGYALDFLSSDRIVKTSENTFMTEAYKKGKEDVMIKVTLN